jgi:glutamate/tyrosine decarboxylase-like PLP-dependent enzyme
MNYLGHDGYLRLNERLMAMRQRYIDGINAIDGVSINGEPHSLIITYSAEGDDVDMFAVADELSKHGWFVGRLRQPPGILIGLSLPHEAVLDEYLTNLADAVETVRATGTKGDAEAPPTY